MNKSASAPNVGFTRSFPPVSGSTSSVSLEGVERHRLPIGVSKLVASRMRLDSTMSPAMLGLRMNTRNLVNEMTYNGGKIVSHQFALMRPRRNQKWEKPKDLDRQGSIKKLQKKANVRNAARQRELQAMEDAKPKKVGSPKHDGQSGSKEADDDEDEAPQANDGDDMTMEQEVNRLLADPRIEEVWKMMNSQANSEEAGQGAQPGLPRTRVARALEALGHPNPDKEMVTDALASIPGDGVLDLNEFTSIVAVFNRQRRSQLKEHFKRLDEDGSGTINVREFSHLLWDLGFTCTYETVQEYLNDADDDQSGEVEFPEFEHACHLVHQHHGFSKKEVEEFEKLFDRYDADGSNEMEADELASAMGWFGAAVTLEQAKGIIARYDDDGNGCLAKPEFLMVIRQRLEDEISEMRSMFHEFDTDDSGTMDGKELLDLFHQCGYTITGQVIEDAIRAALPNNHNVRDVDLVFEDVLKVFYLVRKREGFSEKELEELTDIFNRNDRKGEGELREFELARCFNYMGYPLSPQRRRELWCRVDVDKTESIELGEFLKLVRIIREEETAASRDCLEKSYQAGCKSHLSEPVLKKMLISLGYAPPQQIIDQAMKQSGDSSGDGAIDLFGVLGILRCIREQQVAKSRACAGISDQQAAKVKGKFTLRIDNGKTVDPSELEKLMYEFFPVCKYQEEPRNKMHALVLQETGGKGISDLMQAYWIIRMYHDIRDEDKWEREQNAAADAGFSSWQVASFREAFVNADKKGTGWITMREVQQVFEELMQLNLTQLEALSKAFHAMGAKEHVEFAEFLCLMHVVLQAGQDD